MSATTPTSHARTINSTPLSRPPLPCLAPCSPPPKRIPRETLYRIQFRQVKVAFDLPEDPTSLMPRIRKISTSKNIHLKSFIDAMNKASPASSFCYLPLETKIYKKDLNQQILTIILNSAHRPEHS